MGNAIGEFFELSHCLPQGSRPSLDLFFQMIGVMTQLFLRAAEFMLDFFSLSNFLLGGFVCLVPDLFWRQEPGVELYDRNPEDAKKAFDLYYDFDYDLGVRDMQDIEVHLKTLPECNGKVGAVGYCLGGKLCYLMCCRTDIDCAVAYYGTYIEHRIREAKNLHRPFMLHMAMKDRWVQAEVNDLLERRLAPNPLVTIHKYPGADHAFARHGGKTYSKPEADRALALSIDFFRTHLGR